MRPKAKTAIAGILLSLSVSVLLWVYLDTFVAFLLVPFVPFLFGQRDRSVQTCPRCTFTTTDTEYEFCPRDGSRLEKRS
jgi:hypothetical protein